MRAGAGLLALEAAAGVAALARAEAAPHALARRARLRRLQRMEVQLVCHDLRVLPVERRHRDEVGDVPQLALELARDVCSALLPIRPSPSERSVPRCFCVCPMTLRVWVTDRAHAGASSAGASGVSAGAAAAGCPAAARPSRPARIRSTCRATRDVLRAAQALQAVDRRLRHVDRVRRAEAFEHVADPGELEHGADAAAGDDAGPLARRPAARRARRRTARDLVVIVAPCFGTVKMFFFASSTAFEMASGTSRAFP